MIKSTKNWFENGTPWVWLNAGAVSICLIMVLGLLALIAVRGLGQFWPGNLLEATYTETDGSQIRIIGEVIESQQTPREQLVKLGYRIPGDSELVERQLLKIGNRDHYGLDFRWVIVPSLSDLQHPSELIAMERHEWGNFYGRILALREGDKTVVEGEASWHELEQRLTRKHQIEEQIKEIEKHEIGSINYAMERLRLKRRGLELEGVTGPEAFAEIERQRDQFNAEYELLNAKLAGLYQQINRDSVLTRTAEGTEVIIPLAKIVRVYRPNQMGVLHKSAHYISKLGEFIFDDPREANTEGGIFPAIFGTVLMVLLMTVFVTPFGVVAAVYLREYAKQGPMIRIIRIAVNNLAGVPSVVYGVFGLGFFVYFLGSNIDQLFYPAALPAPTFGTPGLLWSSLTLAILTVPVVIVATEEGLARIPSAIREGSLALGATRAETLWRTVLPMATPAMMTGLILAVARAAGEVAPLMMVGVVKLAPSLGIDANFPFLHLDRKFMHLGFHIYDVGFQSPNVEAARPLVYATALLLVVIIVALNITAIRIRNQLREKYNATSH